MYGYDHFGMGLGGLGMILVWIVLLALLVLLLRRFTQGREDKAVLEILESRYAHGEIGHEEYLKRRAGLDGSASSGI